MTDNAPVQPAPPVEARIAATVLLVRDDPFEVLMVERHAKAVFASALVFPGGVIESEDADEKWLPYLQGHEGLTADQRAIRIGALRETYEETALLLARTPDGEDVPQPAPGVSPFLDVVRDSGGLLALDEIVPFGHWVTPAMQRRRFDTHFLVARAPHDQVPVADGGETVQFEWISPTDAIRLGEEGERLVIFPTRMNLLMLGQSSSADTALDDARGRTIVTVQPEVAPQPDGTRIVTIPAEAGYGVTQDIQKSDPV